MGYIIRPVQNEEDVKKVRHLWDILSENDTPVGPYEVFFSDYYRKYSLVAVKWEFVNEEEMQEREDEVIGCVYYPHFHIGNIGVHPDYQRKGIGSSLLKRVIEQAQIEDAEMVNVTSDQREFLIKNGFLPHPWMPKMKYYYKVR